jgi:hypothetical protein
MREPDATRASTSARTATPNSAATQPNAMITDI